MSLGDNYCLSIFSRSFNHHGTCTTTSLFIASLSLSDEQGKITLSRVFLIFSRFLPFVWLFQWYHVQYVRLGQVVAVEERVQGGRGGGCKKTQTPYGLEELEFMAHLQYADPEHWKVGHWLQSDWFCSAADVQRGTHGYEDKNSLQWPTAWRNCSEFK